MLSAPPPPAVISADNKYRYFLSRVVGFEGSIIAFVGLNPSTADAHLDDPTIRRCKAFTQKWGGRELWMVNLFAFRSTQPEALYTAADPVGIDNDQWLEFAVQNADIVVAAWGNHGNHWKRSDIIRQRFHGKFQTLRVTKVGMPSHPLYVSAAQPLVPFQ